MTIQEIDHLTEAFYECISFNQEHFPKYDQLQDLFYGAGKLINKNFDEPLDFTVQSYIQAIMHQIDEGNVTFHAQQEIADITEVFGSMAQRISVYEYSTQAGNTDSWKRGVNYIQFIQTGGQWKIISMVWNDEKEGLSIPEAYLQS